jgi:hypothetical protein
MKQLSVATHRKQKYLPVLGALCVLAILAIGASIVFEPLRSVGGYCHVYQQENAKLAMANGDTYSTTVFTHGSNNATDFVTAFTRLDSVAPRDIEPEVGQLKTVFQTISTNPAQSFSASLSGLSAESTVTQWTRGHCTKPNN